jgi:ferredoxin-thioredoxin reductase catalytic subunit/rubredoxin
MSSDDAVTAERIDALYKKIDKDARESGYHLNPDEKFTRSLIRGLLVNEDRVGYLSCPCRMPADDRARDLDIICPCDYRDPDLAEYGTCYCALYVGEDVLSGEREVASIPERRPPADERPPSAGGTARSDQTGTGSWSAAGTGEGGLRVWRCRVCGYLCAREEPPERCPICKVSKERFDPFPMG